MFPCVCCGYLTLDDGPGGYDLCPICFWEDDGIQLMDPTYSGGANGGSLLEGQTNYALFGACDQPARPFVRPAGPDDRRDDGWRRIDLELDDFSLVSDKPFPDDGTLLYWWRDTSIVRRR